MGPTSFSYAVTYENKAYMCFGLDENYSQHGRKWIWRYDMQTDDWSRIDEFPGDGRRHPAMVATKNGKIYVGLGDGYAYHDGPYGAYSFNNYKDVWQYDILDGTWTQLDDLPGVARHHPYFFGIENQVFFGMGHSRQGIERDWYKLNAADMGNSVDTPSMSPVTTSSKSRKKRSHLTQLDDNPEPNTFQQVSDFFSYDFNGLVFKKTRIQDSQILHELKELEKTTFQ